MQFFLQTLYFHPLFISLDIYTLKYVHKYIYTPPPKLALKTYVLEINFRMATGEWQQIEGPW